MSNKIDWSNYNQLAKDVWLFLTNDKMPESATISRDALVHEVQAMIQSACMFSREEIRRVKKQRNAYEQELLLANRRLLKMKVELEIEKEKQLQVLPNVKKSTENLSKITDKDEWLKEVRGEFTGEEILLEAKYQLEGMNATFPTKGTEAVIQEIENFLK